MTDSTSPVPEGYHTVTPYLIVEDAPAVLEFIERAFDGSVRSRHDDEEGKVVHAEARIGDSVVMLGQSNDEWPPTRSMIHLYVEDVDRVFQSALEAGARPVREPEDMPYGDRSGGVADPWGTQWWIATPLKGV
jgi:PhnB protein